MSDDNRPTMKDLDPELKGLVRWKKFALHLPMLEQSDIEEIEQDNRGSTENQKLAVFRVWLSKCVSASWLDVVSALEIIDEKSLAEYIKVKHCPVTSFLPSSSTGSHHRIYLNSDDVIIQKLEQLHKSFTDLASRIRERIDELIESGRCSLRNLAIHIEEAQIYRVRGLTAVQTTDEFFELVRPHYNFLDFHLLETLADKFLDEKDLQSIRQHKRNVLDFKRNSQVKSLKNTIKELSAISDQHEPVVIEIENAWGEHPLILVEVLIKHLFMHYSHEVRWFKVISGSICLRFVAPNDICQSLITSSRQKLEFMRLMGVFSLQIGSEYVLQEDENESYTFELALLQSSNVGNNEAVRFLLYMGVNVNHSDTEGNTALIIASEAGHEEVVQTLLSAGADVNYLNSGRIALMSASQNGHSEVVEILLNSNTDPNIQDDSGWTALMCACQNGHSEVVEILLKENADSNIKDENGWTALMSGSRNGHSEVVEILLNVTTDPNIQDNDGWTALMCACQNGHSEVVEILLKGNTDPNIQDNDGWTALMSGSRNGHSEVVEILLNGNTDPNIQDNTGWTALMCACQNGHSEVVKILLDGNADSDIQDKDGFTALMSASRNGHSEVVEILLQENADPNIMGDGWTALMSASRNGHPQVVEILLKKNADPNLQGYNGWNALMSANDNDHSDVADIISCHFENWSSI